LKEIIIKSLKKVGDKEMKLATILVIVIALLAGVGYFGLIPKATADPPESSGPPVNIASPLDPDGNVKVAQQGAVTVEASSPLLVDVDGSVDVSASTPLDINPPDPYIEMIEIWHEALVDPSANPPMATNWIDVSKYRKFKLLVRMIDPDESGNPSPIDPNSPPMVGVNVMVHPDPPPLGPLPPPPNNYGNVAMDNYMWESYLNPPFDPRWAMSPEFEGLYPYIRIYAIDFSPGDIDDYKISLWLLMAKE